jgi:hypothetical protein
MNDHDQESTVPMALQVERELIEIRRQLRASVTVMAAALEAVSSETNRKKLVVRMNAIAKAGESPNATQDEKAIGIHARRLARRVLGDKFA